MKAHELAFVDTSTTGEVWVCPDCGRAVEVAWDPWTRTVLTEGDGTVPHVASKGGARMDGAYVTPAAPGEDDLTWLSEAGVIW